MSWRWAKDERFIHNAVETYAKVYPNLKIHNAEYPDPKILLSKIRYGNIEFDGDISKDTPGSDLIKSLMLDDKPGHLFITAWGGHSTIARALKSIKDQYEFTEEWDNIRNKVSRKVILLPSGDQDDTYAKYIKPNWPDLFPAAQRDFAARLKWSVTPKYTDANHAPAVTVQGPLEIVASSWETIRLNANVTDHDGNKIAIRWWQLHVGSYKGNAAITDENSARAKVFIPKDAVPGQTLHIIVETTDDGVPSMTAYQR